MKYLFALCLLLSSLAHSAHYPIMIGDKTVIIQTLDKGSGKHFIHLHENETTALKAAKSVIEDEGGSVLTLRHGSTRNIVFHLHHKRYEFDPNRIFTPAGIKATLSQLGAYSPEAHAEVQKLAKKIIELTPRGKVIAVHNNRSYSMRNYLPGNSLATDAKSLSMPNKAHYRNFYVVTQKSDFYRLKKLGFNAVLQADSPTDDGSLSVYLSHSHYINVEAAYNQLAAQIKLLKNA